MNQNGQVHAMHANGRPGHSNLLDISMRLERNWFKFDRSAALRQIDLVRGVIGANLDELSLVAAEGVFDKPLSDRLLRASRSMRSLTNELDALRILVARSDGYPRTGIK